MFPIANFAVSGDASPSTLPHVIALLAQLELVPVHVSMRRLGNVALVAIVQDGIEPTRAVLVAEKMRALVVVQAVEVTFHTESNSKERT